MATLTLTFPNPLNTSLQIGDVAYHMTTSNQTLSDGGYDYVDSTDGTAYDGSNPPVFYENQSGNAVQAHGTFTPDTNLIEIGNITSVNNTTNVIQVYTGGTTTRPTTSSFIMFSKDSRANMSSLMGYYAEVELICTDTEEAEIFAVNSEVVESSK